MSAFLQAVGDQHQTDALLTQVSDDLQQLVGFGAGQCRGRLVQNEHLGVQVDGTGDLHQLPLPDAQFAHGGGRIDVQTHPLEQADRLPSNPGPVNESEATWLASQKQVLRHGQLRNHGEFLVDHRDAEFASPLRGGQPDRATVDSYRACVRRVHPGEDFHQRGFTCAVLADQHVHLAGSDSEVDSIQRERVGEALGDSLGLQNFSPDVATHQRRSPSMHFW